MALNPSTAYPAQVDTTDPTGYPYGKAKNVTAIGDGTGTPLERLWLSDLFGFEQALLASASITPSGTPDRVGGSQYLTALTALADARSKLALAKSQALNWPERASFGSGAAVNSDTPFAFDRTQGVNLGGLFMCTTSATQSQNSSDGTQWGTLSSFGGVLLSAAKDLSAGLVSGVPSFLASGTGNNNLIQSTDGVLLGI